MSENKVRLSSIINAFGPGAIIDMREISVIGLGMEDWINSLRMKYSSDNVPELVIVREERLIKKLKKAFPSIRGFIQLTPSTFFNNATGSFETRLQWYPVRVFPQWMFCENCRRLKHFEYLRMKNRAGTEVKLWETPYNCQFCYNVNIQPKENPKLVSSRFIVACEDGHLDDFPWILFAHYPEQPCKKPDLYLRVRGRSSGLRDMVVACENCDLQQDLSDVFNNIKGLFQNFSCSGRRPELRLGRRPDTCDKKMEALLRGATNAYFPRIESALSIPLLEDKSATELREFILGAMAQMTFEVITNENVGLMKTMIANRFPENSEITEREIFSLGNRAGGNDEEMFQNLRKYEFESLIDNQTISLEQSDNLLESVHIKIEDYSDIIGKIFNKIVVVSKLREVRVLTGFNRIKVPGDLNTQLATRSIEDDNISYVCRVPYSIRFLPGVEYFGEGILFQLNSSMIQSISTNQFFSERMNRLGESETVLSAQDVLTHSLAHAMIVALAEVVGYSMSSMRERLYINIKKDDHNFHSPGFLIYTASPDSEGSLGGLIKTINSKQINQVMERMMENMSWCSSDPVCIELQASRDDAFRNNAACHACLFIPETSCELRNEFLDRATLVGTTGIENRKHGVLWL